MKEVPNHQSSEKVILYYCVATAVQKCHNFNIIPLHTILYYVTLSHLRSKEPPGLHSTASLANCEM